MFTMIIEQQMNISNRTLLLGVPDFDTMPESITIENRNYKVLGISSGVKLPYISLEIEKIDSVLKGKKIVA